MTYETIEDALEYHRSKPQWITKLNKDGTIMWEGEYEDFHKGNIIISNPFLPKNTCYEYDGAHIYSSKNWYKKVVVEDTP